MPIKEGRKLEYPEKSPGDELQKWRIYTYCSRNILDFWKKTVILADVAMQKEKQVQQ